jgi:hypothetical protein
MPTIGEKRMSQDHEDVSIFIIVSNQEVEKGFKRIVELSSGEKVAIHISVGSSSNNDEKKSIKNLGMSVIQAVLLGVISGVIVSGIILFAINRLPPTLLLIGAAIGTILTLTASFGGTLFEKFFQDLKKKWLYPLSLIVMVLSLVGTIPVFLYFAVGRNDPYHFLAVPAFSDSLSNGSNDNLWYTGKFGPPKNNNSVDCKFDNEHFLISSASKHFIEWCQATTTDFRDFVYEIQMNIVKGDCAGIVFRADVEHTRNYTFDFCWDRVYHLFAYYGSNKSDTLIGGIDKNIKSISVLNQNITLGIVARGIDFELYVNRILVNTAFDTSGNELKEGEIGIEARDLNSMITIAEFNNANVWTF